MRWGYAPQIVFFQQEFVVSYVKPAVQRFGSLVELTLGQGPSLGGDATSLYHRS
jgi:hypothetical protein